MTDEFDLRKYVPEEDSRKIFAKVFDKSTIETIHKLATKRYFDIVEFTISTGKEAHVFRAVDESGNFRAVKIYKIATSDFKHMSQYIEGDRRFKGMKKNKRDIVFTWAKKEFKNLNLLMDAGIRVPMPIVQMNNVLVMEFIGKNGEAAPLLKDSKFSDSQKLYDFIVENFVRMVQKAELIHGDLSQYNIINNSGELVIIDVGQAVLTSHPKAKEFFERDVRNMATYFQKIGIKTDYNALRADIKAKKEEFS